MVFIAGEIRDDTSEWLPRDSLYNGCKYLNRDIAIIRVGRDSYIMRSQSRRTDDLYVYDEGFRFLAGRSPAITGTVAIPPPTSGPISAGPLGSAQEIQLFRVNISLGADAWFEFTEVGDIELSYAIIGLKIFSTR
jgi:hypothetical protein